MTVKGFGRMAGDPRNRAVAHVTDNVNIAYLGQMESLVNRPRRWNITTMIHMGHHDMQMTDGGVTISAGGMTDHFTTEKMKMSDAISDVVEMLRCDMGGSRNSVHTIYLVISINLN